MSRLPGISKSNKRMRERQKSRQEVSCSWTCGRYRSARTHVHTSFTTLRTTPQFNPTLPKAKPLKKRDQAGKGGETFASSGM